jgi:hypothetical protein
VRFNLFRGGSESIDAIESMARHIFDLAQWHIELYADAAELVDLVPCSRASRKWSSTIWGCPRGFANTAEAGGTRVKVKATGFGRVTMDVASALKAIAAADPRALMFGTDLPSTRAPRPFAISDIDLLRDALGDERARLALYDNAVDFYAPGP